jgi:NAD(P)H dehydrogenase (quinone)
MITITGANGKLGQIIIDGLLQSISAQDIRAVVRNRANGQRFEKLGIDVRIGDYIDPQSLVDAFEGSQTILLISSNALGQRTAHHSAAIFAARNTGAQHIIYTSGINADHSSLHIVGEHVATEKMIRESGIPYTFLRNGWYVENFDFLIRLAASTGSFKAGGGTGRLGAVPRRDFAEAAVKVLTSGEHVGKVYELTGDELWSYGDLANAISRVTGKPVVYKDVDAEEQREFLSEIGVPEPLIEKAIESDRSLASGELEILNGELAALIGRPTTPLLDSARLVLGA